MGFASNMFVQLLVQVIGLAASFFSGLFALRFILQWVRAPYRNPLSQFVVTLTNWGVVPLRRVVPGWRGLDLSSLVMSWLIESVAIAATVAVLGAPLLSGGSLVPLIFVAGLVEMLRMILYVVLGATLGMVVLSWVNPYAPMAPVFDAISAPFLRPFRRLVPAIGGIDLSPLFLLLLLQLLLGLLASLKSGLIGFAS